MGTLPLLFFPLALSADVCVFEGSPQGACQNGGDCMVDKTGSLSFEYGSGGNSDPACVAGGNANCYCRCKVPECASGCGDRYVGTLCHTLYVPDCTYARSCAATFAASGCDWNAAPPCDPSDIPAGCQDEFVKACSATTDSPSASPSTTSPSARPSAGPSTTSPTLAPTSPPTQTPISPTTQPTKSPSRAPTQTPTASPTRHPCNTGAHGCDASPGGACFTVGATGWVCGCGVGYTCTANCSDDSAPHGCAPVTIAPTGLPPTFAPTVHPTTRPSAAPSPAPTLSPSTLTPTSSPVRTTSPPTPTGPTSAPTKPDACTVPRGGTHTPCTSSGPQSSAASQCAAAGMRLCTAAELVQKMRGADRPSTCVSSVWSGTPCVTASRQAGHVAVLPGGSARCVEKTSAARLPVCCDGPPTGSTTKWRLIGPGRCVDAAWADYTQRKVTASTVEQCQKQCEKSVRTLYPCRGITWVEWSSPPKTACYLELRSTVGWTHAGYWLLSSAPTRAISGVSGSYTATCYAPPQDWGEQGSRIGCFAEEPGADAAAEHYCPIAGQCTECDATQPFVSYPASGSPAAARCLSRLPGPVEVDCFGSWRTKVYHNVPFDSQGAGCFGLATWGEAATASTVTAYPTAPPQTAYPTSLTTPYPTAPVTSYPTAYPTSSTTPSPPLHAGINIKHYIVYIVIGAVITCCSAALGAFRKWKRKLAQKVETAQSAAAGAMSYPGAAFQQDSAQAVYHAQHDAPYPPYPGPAYGGQQMDMRASTPPMNGYESYPQPLAASYGDAGAVDVPQPGGVAAIPNPYAAGVEAAARGARRASPRVRRSHNA